MSAIDPGLHRRQRLSDRSRSALLMAGLVLIIVAFALFIRGAGEFAVTAMHNAGSDIDARACLPPGPGGTGALCSLAPYPAPTALHAAFPWLTLALPLGVVGVLLVRKSSPKLPARVFYYS